MGAFSQLIWELWLCLFRPKTFYGKMTFLGDWLISCIWLWPWKWTRFWKSLICFVIPNNYINKTFINISRTYIGKHFLLGQFESLKMEIDPKFNIDMKYELGKWVVWGAVPPGGRGGGVLGVGVKSFGKKSTASHRQSMGREGRIERSY